MSDIRNTAKPNMISVNDADMGEIVAPTNSDSPAPPAGDGDTWSADPMTTPTVGKTADNEDHNSGWAH